MINDREGLLFKEDPDAPTSRHGPARFTILGRFSLPFSVVLGFFAVGVVLGFTGQQISLPLYLSTFSQYAGAFYVLWFSSLCFTLIFGSCALFLLWKGAISPEERQWRWHKYMFLVGFFDALNGVLVVFSSFVNRVSGPLQSILAQSVIPFTLILSFILLRKKYNWKQCMGAVIVAFGIILSLTSVFQALHQGQAGQTKWYWAVILIIGFVPAALMNIVQEKMQDTFRQETTGDTKRFSIMYFQAIESFYQLSCMTLLFWSDIVPGFGTSDNIDVFWSNFSFDWKCFFGANSSIELSPHCRYCGGLGLFFILSYLTTYITSTGMTLYSSANTLSLISTIPPGLSVIFWFAFPSVNQWAKPGSPPYSRLEFWTNLGAIPLLLIGCLLFRWEEREDKQPDKDEGDIELCF